MYQLFKEKNNENDRDRIIRRVNQHSYAIIFNYEEEKNEFYSGRSTLTDISTEFIHYREHLLTSKGFIRIKEYTIDAYDCRCHEHHNRLIDEKINDHQHLVEYKLDF